MFRTEATTAVVHQLAALGLDADAAQLALVLAFTFVRMGNLVLGLEHNLVLHGPLRTTTCVLPLAVRVFPHGSFQPALRVVDVDCVRINHGRNGPRLNQFDVRRLAVGKHAFQLVQAGFVRNMRMALLKLGKTQRIPRHVAERVGGELRLVRTGLHAVEHAVAVLAGHQLASFVHFHLTDEHRTRFEAVRHAISEPRRVRVALTCDDISAVVDVAAQVGERAVALGLYVEVRQLFVVLLRLVIHAGAAHVRRDEVQVRPRLQHHRVTDRCTDLAVKYVLHQFLTVSVEATAHVSYPLLSLCPGLLAARDDIHEDFDDAIAVELTALVTLRIDRSLWQFLHVVVQADIVDSFHVRLQYLVILVRIEDRLLLDVTLGGLQRLNQSINSSSTH